MGIIGLFGSAIVLSVGYKRVLPRALLLGEPRELRKRALPSPILLHKKICRSFLRGEALPHEFALGCS